MVVIIVVLEHVPMIVQARVKDGVIKLAQVVVIPHVQHIADGPPAWVLVSDLAEAG